MILVQIFKSWLFAFGYFNGVSFFLILDFGILWNEDFEILFPLVFCLKISIKNDFLVIFFEKEFGR